MSPRASHSSYRISRRSRRSSTFARRIRAISIASLRSLLIVPLRVQERCIGWIMVEDDALRLEQVLGNLLSNAVKYSPDGGTIDVALTTDATHAMIDVRDMGIGIPPADQPKLFQQFYRARNVDPKRISGLGIGLYIVGEIIARHDGTIGVASEEHAGSSFTVRLPLLETDAPAPEHPA